MTHLRSRSTPARAIGGSDNHAVHRRVGGATGRRLARAVGVTTLAVGLGAGCGLGAGQQYQQITLHTARSGAERPTPPAHAGLRMNTLTLYDSWGMFVGAIATHNNAVSARDAAVREAVEDGAVSGDQIDYEYAVVPPRPGRLTTIKFGWGRTDTVEGLDADGQSNTIVGGDPLALEAFEFDFTTGLALWGFEDCCNVGLTLGAVYQSWEVGERIDATRTAMPLGVSLGTDLFGRAHLSVSGKLDVAATLFASLLGEHWLDATAGALLTTTLTDWLHLHIEGTYGRVSLDGGDAWGELLQVGAALAVTYSPDED